jgi:hypothetical protein
MAASRRSPGRARRAPAASRRSPDRARAADVRLVRVVRSPRAGKKWRAVFARRATGATFVRDFGDAAMEDYTMHRDPERRRRYWQRHTRDLRTGDPTRAGFLSAELLWGASTSLAANVAAYRRRHGV